MLCYKLNELNIDNVVNDVVNDFENIAAHRQKGSLRKTIARIVESILNSKRKHIYKRVSIFPYKFPNELDEYIFGIGKIDDILFYQVYYSRRSLTRPRYTYKVEAVIQRYSKILNYCPLEYWSEKQYELGYKTAIKALRGFKLPEFTGNESVFYGVSRWHIKKRKDYTIIKNVHTYSYIVCTTDDFVAVPFDIFDRVTEKIHRKTDGKTLLQELRKELLLDSF